MTPGPERPRNVLVTNDDGIDSDGLAVLAGAAAGAGLAVTVAAPSWDASGASASFTAVEHDGRVVQEERTIAALPGVRAVAIEAAPAFIVRAAVAGAFGEPPELVISGVNHGANLGAAVLHSGTVGAATTAATLGRRGLAVSVDTRPDRDVVHWDTVSAVLDDLLVPWVGSEVGVLNVNVPDIGLDDLQGIQAADLAPFGAVQAMLSEAGGGTIHLTYHPVDAVPPPGSDAALLAAGFATMTPLRGVCTAPAELVEDLVSPARGGRDALPCRDRPGG